MKRILVTTFAVVALAGSGLSFGTAAMAAPSAPSAPASYACGQTPPPDKDHSKYVNAKNQQGLFSGSSSNCARLATVYPTDTLDFYCKTTNPEGTWTYVRDASGGLGWANSAYLPNRGSTTQC